VEWYTFIVDYEGAIVHMELNFSDDGELSWIQIKSGGMAVEMYGGSQIAFGVGSELSYFPLDRDVASQMWDVVLDFAEHIIARGEVLKAVHRVYNKDYEYVEEL